MTVTEARIDEIVAKTKELLDAGVRSGLEREMKAAFPDFRVGVCSEDDVNVRPIRETETFDLHLIGGDGHCLALTRNPERAIGVLVALREEGE